MEASEQLDSEIRCGGRDCPIKWDCKRYLTNPLNSWALGGKIVSYLSPPYINGECTEFVQTEKSEQDLR